MSNENGQTSGASRVPGEVLYRLVMAKDDAGLKRVLANPAEVNFFIGGEFLLHKAAQFGTAGSVMMLIAAGAIEEAKSATDGSTSGVQTGFGGMLPIHAATTAGNLETLEVLCANPRAVNAPNDGYHRPLHIAAQPGTPEVSATAIGILLKHGANINAKNALGETPLHAAAELGHVAAVAALMEAGADRGAIDNNGHTALDLAQIGDHADVVAAIRSFEARLKLDDVMETRKPGGPR